MAQAQRVTQFMVGNSLQPFGGAHPLHASIEAKRGQDARLAWHLAQPENAPILMVAKSR